MSQAAPQSLPYPTPAITKLGVTQSHTESSENQTNNKRTASECGLTKNDNLPPSKKLKLDIKVNNINNKNDDNSKIKQESNNDQNNDNKKVKRLATRKVALIVSYLGTNYHGSAYGGQQGIPTICGILYKTISKIGAISLLNSDDPKKVKLSQSSRTDKGVHAAAATFALKMSNLFEDPLKESIIGSDHAKNKKDFKKRLIKNKKVRDKEREKIKSDNNLTLLNDEEWEKKEKLIEELEYKKFNELEKKLNAQKIEYVEWNKMVHLLNNNLPKDIIVQGIHRTTKKFDPRYDAWSRIYHYMIPSYLFDKNIKTKYIPNIQYKFCKSIINKLKERKIKKMERKNKKILNNDDDNNDDNDDLNDDDIDWNENEQLLMKFAKDILKESNHEMNEEIHNNNSNDNDDARYGYRISSELLNKLEELTQIYIGTKNYHNFTRKTNPKEDRAKRYMYWIKIVNKSLIINNMEFIQFELHGTSFIYHQIRKMIGLLVTIMRENQYMMCDDDDDNTVMEWDKDDLIEKAFSMDYKMAIPLAPGFGLYLKQVTFDRYNKKCDHNEQYWTKMNIDSYKDGINKFILENISPAIVKYEIDDNNQFAFWLYGLENDFAFQIIKITADKLDKLKKNGNKYITAGKHHEPLDKFLQKLIHKCKNAKKGQ